MSEALYYFNFCFAIFGLLYACLKAMRASVVLTPAIVFWIVYIYVIYYPNIGSEITFQNIIDYNLIYTTANIGAFIATIISPPVVAPKSKKILFSKNLIDGLSAIYLFYLFCTVFFVIVDAGGVFNALSTSRLEPYLNGEITKGQGFEMLMIIPAVGYSIMISILMERKRYITALFSTVPIIVFYFFTANTRLPIIMPLLAYAIVFVNMLKPKFVKILMPITLIFGTVFVLLYSVIASTFRNGRLTDLGEIASNIGQVYQTQNSTQLGYYGWVYELYSKLQSGLIPYDFGAAWLYYSLISFIPRRLWDGKPLTSTSNRLTEAVAGQNVGDGTLIYTYTVIGEGYLQFSYIGSFLAPILIILGYQFFLRKLSAIQGSSFLSALILIEMAPFVRAEMPVVQLIMYSMIIFLIAFLSRLKHRQSIIQ